MNWRKIVSIFIAILLVLNMALFGFKIIGVSLFWAVLLVSGLLVYSGILKKK